MATDLCLLSGLASCKSEQSTRLEPHTHPSAPQLGVLCQLTKSHHLWDGPTSLLSAPTWSGKWVSDCASPAWMAAKGLTSHCGPPFHSNLEQKAGLSAGTFTIGLSLWEVHLQVCPHLSRLVLSQLHQRMQNCKNTRSGSCVRRHCLQDPCLAHPCDVVLAQSRSWSCVQAQHYSSIGFSPPGPLASRLSTLDRMSILLKSEGLRLLGQSHSIAEFCKREFCKL